MNIVALPQNNTIIDEKMNFVESTKQDTDNKELLFNIIEKQAKDFEEFGKRMSLELHNLKQQNDQKLYPGVDPEVTCCECKEKTELINSLKARIQELEIDSVSKSQSIKKLQKDVQSLYDIIEKKGKTNFEKPDIDIAPAKITITTAVEEEFNINNDNVEVRKIEKDRLSVESFQNFQYDDNIKDCYSDSAIDLFTDDDDDSSTTGGSVKSEDSDYVHKPSEWLDISPSLAQRAKIEKRNLDRWNSKMASNGLLPIRLVGKVDAEREKKYQTHRKRYSTSAIWLKTYESKQDPKKNKDEKFKIPSFGFTFNTTDDTKKKNEIKITDPISLKSSVSTSVSELSTTSLATTSLQSYEVFSKDHHKNAFNSKSQQILSQYK